MGAAGETIKLARHAKGSPDRRAGASAPERLIHMLYGHFQRVAADKAGVVGVQQVAEHGAAAFLGEIAVDTVPGDAQRQGADFSLVVAEVAPLPLNEQLAVGTAKPELPSSAILMVVVQPSTPMVWVSL